MKTTIHSNGSKWAGQSLDGIDTLLDVLSKEPLDPSFEDYGDFVYGVGPTRFFGNFATISHVFRIDTHDPDTIARLTAAIRANRATEAYSQLRKEWGSAKTLNGVVGDSITPFPALTSREFAEVLWALEGGIHELFTEDQYQVLINKLRRISGVPSLTVEG